MDCHQLSHGISIEKDCLHDCCLLRMVNDDGSPYIIGLDENHLVDWEKVFEAKKSQKEQKMQDPHACKGCRSLCENLDFSKDPDYFTFINFNHWNRCNARCVYCNHDAFDGDRYYNSLPLIKSLFEYKNGECLRNYGEVTFQGGEATVLPEFEELLDLFAEKEMRVRIHSNGIKYSEAIARSLAKNLVSVVISPDTAIPETYEKIKQVPCCEKSWESIKKYAAVQCHPDLVKAKFIVVAGINDTLYEIDKFIEKCLECGVSHVIWEIEDRYLSMYDQDVPHICLLIDYAMYKAEKAGLKDEFYDGAMYGMAKRSVPKEIITDETEFARKYEEMKAKCQDRNLDYLKFL